MTRISVLLLGALAAVIFALIILIILPTTLMAEVPRPAGLRPYTSQELRGREVYIANGCVYCHSQQLRDRHFTVDVARGWGTRSSVPADYVYDSPHLMGTMRTGPDLFNVGIRLPDPQWQLLHLYQPRAVVPWSIMPSHPFLFQHKESAVPGDQVLALPPQFAPASGVIVATPDAKALVAYLLALKHDYPAPAHDASGSREDDDDQ